MAKVSPVKQSLDGILKTYLENMRTGGHDGTSEMEIRFGTANRTKPISRIEYENVIKRFVSSGFTISKPQYLLRIASEFTDKTSAVTKISNIRAELSGIGAISEYCKTGSIDSFYKNKRIKFIQKMPQKVSVDGETVSVQHYDATDYNFRASLSLETDYTQTDTAAKMVDSWKDVRKDFRYINRHTLTHKDYPLNVDVSIVKQTNKKGSTPVYTFADANINSIQERYEIELEIVNEKVGKSSSYSTNDLLMVPIRRAIMTVLSGLQGTNFPVSYPRQTDILDEYMRILMGETYVAQRALFSKNFVGPSSVALQITNISEGSDGSNVPNIRKDYTVTEKADGDRKLLMISSVGDLYLIDTNMRVQFTGARTARSELFMSIIDGEHISQNKKGAYINLYAAFDIYYKNNKDLRKLDFSRNSGAAFRLPMLHDVFKNLDAFGIKSRESPSPMRFVVKTFYSGNDTSIFDACSSIIKKVNADEFEYKTDGLIFTPMFTGVGGSKSGETTEPHKTTWNLSFKWKPPEHNTVDFLVTMQRGADGNDDIKNVFQSGTDIGSALQITQYKTAVLRVGFNEHQHGFINPCLNVINDDIPVSDGKDSRYDYKPMRFYPSNPSDDEAGLCNLLLRQSVGGTYEIFTENHEIIEDNMIVEFRYNKTKDHLWKWEPLRVRYDKTTELINGGKNFGNAYHVADSTWHSIHKPITETMITTGKDISIETGDDGLYYNRSSGKRISTSMRDFHNLYVKKKLIQSVSKRNDTLIDFAVGKAGDLSKWHDANLKFVFGIDIARDNLENRLDGACVRYLKNRKKYKDTIRALFVNGNSSLNIKDTAAIVTEKGKQITNAVFGIGAKDERELGKGVYKQYGIAEHGFDIASIQFAVHYMFETITTLNNFLRNVSETTKVGGYFIGTCYDGTKLFNELKRHPTIETYEGGFKTWSVVKKYDNDSFNPDASSLGYAVDVFIDSIGKVFREYLVNFDYLDRMLNNYGFVKISPDEAHRIGLESGTGSFESLFKTMEKDSRRTSSKNEYGSASDMTHNEKKNSFLYNYFVYKKTNGIDAKTIATTMIAQSDEVVYSGLEEPPGIDRGEPTSEKPAPVTEETPLPKKLKKKLVLRPRKD